jgi:endogenous inhibitor of DNA gyrase (YacG/DUF329 family)
MNPASSTRTCPICAKPLADEAYRPFCSRRCADIDLNRWLSSVYAVPSAEEEGSSDGDAAEADRVAGQP